MWMLEKEGGALSMSGVEGEGVHVLKLATRLNEPPG